MTLLIFLAIQTLNSGYSVRHSYLLQEQVLFVQWLAVDRKVQTGTKVISLPAWIYYWCRKHCWWISTTTLINKFWV